MRIGIDVDGVLRDFVGYTIEIYKKEFPSHRVVDYENWVWDLKFNFPDHHNINKWVFNDRIEEIMRNAPAFPNAIDSLNDLVRNTLHDYVIVSSQRKGKEYLTMEWLGKHEVEVPELYFTQEKIKANCEVLVEDKTENLQAYYQSGKIIVPVARPWNRSWTKTKRYEGFVKAAEYLKTL